MKKLIMLLVILSTVFGCAKKDKTTFIVGFTDYPPMGFKDTDGSPIGFDIDMASEIFKRMGKDVEFQYVNWDSKHLELQSGSIDAIWNGFTITEQRKQEVLFTNSYLDNAIVIITRKEDANSISSMEDLKGLHIGVEAQSSGQHYLEDTIDTDKDLKLVKFTSISEALLDLKAGNTDAIVADEVYSRYILGKDDAIAVVEGIRMNAEQYAIGLRKEDVEMQKELNEQIEQMIVDGTLSEISMKWFNEDLIKK